MTLESKDFILLLLAIPISIAANLATPAIKNWAATLNERLRKRRIRGLEAELTRYEQMSSSDRYLFLHLIHRLAAALSMTVVAGSILVVMTYWSFVDRYALMFAYPYLVLCSNMFIPVSHICMRAKDDNFERIKAKTRADIERLRGRLSDASSCYHD